MSLAYIVKTENWRHVWSSIGVMHALTGRPRLGIVSDMLGCTAKMGFTFRDYFDCNLWAKSPSERREFAGTELAHEFHVAMNRPEYRHLFRDKARFLSTFSAFAKRGFLYVPSQDRQTVLDWVAKREVFVAKPNFGVSGKGVQVVRRSMYADDRELLADLSAHNLDLLEDLIVQHEELRSLNPSCVNTVRFVTVRRVDGSVDLIGAVLRLGVNNHVDNMNAGGIAAPIDVQSGAVCGPAVSTRYPRVTHLCHPVTGKPIVGFRVPFWEDAVNFVVEASAVVPEVRTVGWDVAVAPDGPVMVEGNDNWGKNGLQIPYDVGLRNRLRDYLVVG
jgi:hypothetical protein